MKVLLKQDVDSLGLAGDICNVADGYGRNYLMPQGLAIRATDGSLKQAEAWREKATARRAQLRAEYQSLVEKIEAVELSFIARAGEKGKLYGSVTTADVADRLNERLGIDLDRRIFSGGPLRQLGEHPIAVRFDKEFQANFSVVIRSEEQIAAEAKAKADAIVAEKAAAEAAVKAAAEAKAEDVAGESVETDA